MSCGLAPLASMSFLKERLVERVDCSTSPILMARSCCAVDISSLRLCRLSRCEKAEETKIISSGLSSPTTFSSAAKSASEPPPTPPSSPFALEHHAVEKA